MCEGCESKKYKIADVRTYARAWECWNVNKAVVDLAYILGGLVDDFQGERKEWRGAWNKLRRFSENLQRFMEKVRRFFFFLRHFLEKVPRFCGKVRSWEVLSEKICKFFWVLFGGMVGNTYFCSEFIKVGEVQRRFAVLVSCFSYFFGYILLEVLTQL